MNKIENRLLEMMLVVAELLIRTGKRLFAKVDNRLENKYGKVIDRYMGKI